MLFVGCATDWLPLPPWHPALLRIFHSFIPTSFRSVTLSAGARLQHNGFVICLRLNLYAMSSPFFRWLNHFYCCTAAAVATGVVNLTARRCWLLLRELLILFCFSTFFSPFSVISFVIFSRSFFIVKCCPWGVTQLFNSVAAYHYHHTITAPVNSRAGFHALIAHYSLLYPIQFSVWVWVRACMRFLCAISICTYVSSLMCECVCLHINSRLERTL